MSGDAANLPNFPMTERKKFGKFTTSPIVVIVAGGTGGHLYPGIAAARALVKLGTGWEAVFIVRKGDLGKALLEREGFRVFELSGQGWPRRVSLKMFTFPYKVIAGLCEAWVVLGRLKPQGVMGMGGYLSFPVLISACLRRIPTLIHEQNVFPGLANRLMGRWVRSIAVSFPESKVNFPTGKAWLSGLPVRPEIGRLSQEEGWEHFKLARDRLTVLVFGGSQGARRINEAVAGAWPLLSERTRGLQVLHVTGERDYSEMKERYRTLSVQAAVMPYCHEMAAALAAADWVICRAGASTVAELLMAQKPALLVPFPFASENHQFYNANVLVSQGAAEQIKDEELTPATIAESLRRMMRDPGHLRQMRDQLAALAKEAPHGEAARRLADYITRMS